MKRTCLDLGLCQSRTPACPDCDHPWRLAPGVIDGPFQSPRHQIRVGRWIKVDKFLAYLAVMVIASALLGFLLGYISRHLPRWLS